MSRIGKKPIEIIKGATVEIKDNVVSVKGRDGELNFRIPSEIEVKINGNFIIVSKAVDTLDARRLWGTIRTVIDNMIYGVMNGFKKQLLLVGIGYRAVVKGSVLTLSLGYSHPIEFPLPKIVKAKVEQNILTLESYDKVLLGNVAAKIRNLRPPEPYKGKGIRYVGEHIIRKAGKAGAK